MNRYQIAAYLLIAIGLASCSMYVIGNFIQEAHAFQIANDITPRPEAGAFWLNMDPQPFIFPGVVLIVIGMATVFYGAKKQLDKSQLDAQAEQDTIA